MITDAFAKAEVGDVIHCFNSIDNQSKKYFPEFGPLPKSSYTFLLEELTRRLMENQSFETTFEENLPCLVFIDGTKYNISHILSYANFEHIQFNAIDLVRYEHYYKSYNKSYTPTAQFFADREQEYLNSFDLADQGVTELYPELTYGHKLAVYKYSSMYYESINSFLRGTYDFKKKTSQQIRDVIVHSALLSAALIKISSIPVPEGSFRYESTTDNAVFSEAINKRIALCQTGQAEVIKGFISTSTGSIESIKMNVATTYTDLKGVFIAPLSKFPNECEFLIPPTQIKYSGYLFENDTHYFHAQPAVDLALIAEQAKQLPTEQERLVFKTQELLSNIQTLRSLINSSSNDFNKNNELDRLEEWINNQINTIQKNEDISLDKCTTILSQAREKLADFSISIQQERLSNNLIKDVTEGGIKSNTNIKDPHLQQQETFKTKKENLIEQYHTLYNKLFSALSKGLESGAILPDSTQRDDLINLRYECAEKWDVLKRCSDDKKMNNFENCYSELNDKALVLFRSFEKSLDTDSISSQAPDLPNINNTNDFKERIKSIKASNEINGTDNQIKEAQQDSQFNPH